MTVSEVLQVVKGCQEARVRHFEFDGLKLEFQEQHTGQPLAVEDPSITNRNLEENEIRIKMEQLEEIKLRDPLLYEQIAALETER